MKLYSSALLVALLSTAAYAECPEDFAVCDLANGEQVYLTTNASCGYTATDERGTYQLNNTRIVLNRERKGEIVADVFRVVGNETQRIGSATCRTIRENRDLEDFYRMYESGQGPLI